MAHHIQPGTTRQPTYIIGSMQGNSDERAMQASRELRAGEEILRELPLFEYPQIPLVNIHEDPFAEYRLYNGQNTIDEALNRMIAAAPDKIYRLRRLKGQTQYVNGAPAPTSDMSIIQTNEFTHFNVQNGVTYAYIRVFDDISRCNHSCKPNALVEWNESEEQGTLYALETIPEGAEITVDHFGSAEHSLLATGQRCEKTAARWGFWCACRVCTAPERAKNVDDERRLRALGLYHKLRTRSTEVQKHPLALTDQLLKDMLKRRDDLQEYIDVLKQIDIRDGKLAEAYFWLAKTDEQLYYLARRTTEVPITADKDDTKFGTPSTFLNRAIANARLTWTTELVYCGLNHPEVMKSWEYEASLEHIRIGQQT